MVSIVRIYFLKKEQDRGLMFAPDDHLGIFAALMGISALAFWLERTRLGALLTGTVIVILLSVLAAML